MSGELPLQHLTQPRRSHTEAEQFHRAVVALRFAGNVVWRAGRNHSLINGRRVPNAMILKNSHFETAKN